MPVHRVPRPSLHEDLKAIEREGESILSITPDGDVFVVVTRFKGDEIETRQIDGAFTRAPRGAA